MLETSAFLLFTVANLRFQLSYYDLHAETVIETDASPKGLGAVLLQDGQPVCYASKAFTKTEQQYSNIEHEALGITWGLERFHYFI